VEGGSSFVGNKAACHAKVISHVVDCGCVLPRDAGFRFSGVRTGACYPRVISPGVGCKWSAAEGRGFSFFGTNAWRMSSKG